MSVESRMLKLKNYIRIPITATPFLVPCLLLMKNAVLFLSVLSLPVVTLAADRHLNSGGFCVRKLNEDSHVACAKQVEICSLEEHCADLGLSVLKIPDVIDGYKVTHIAPLAFAGNQDIVAVEISSNVCQIGRRAFYGCSNLVSVSMANCAFHPMSIHSEAFCRCVRLATLSFPVGLKMLDVCAFAECSSLENVTVPDSCAAYMHR